MATKIVLQNTQVDNTQIPASVTTGVATFGTFQTHIPNTFTFSSSSKASRGGYGLLTSISGRPQSHGGAGVIGALGYRTNVLDNDSVSQVIFQNIETNITQIPASVTTGAATFGTFQTHIPNTFSFTSSSKSSRGGYGLLTSISGRPQSHGGAGMDGMLGFRTNVLKIPAVTFNLTSSVITCQAVINTTTRVIKASTSTIIGQALLLNLAGALRHGGCTIIGQAILTASAVSNVFSSSTIIGVSAVTAVRLRLVFAAAIPIIAQAIITCTRFRIFNYGISTTITGQAVITCFSGQTASSTIIGQAVVSATRFRTYFRDSTITGVCNIFVTVPRTYFCVGLIQATAVVTANRIRLVIGNTNTIIGTAGLTVLHYEKPLIYNHPIIITGTADLIVSNTQVGIPFPIITLVVPDHVEVGSPDTTITVTGLYFDSTCVVNWVQSPPVPLITTFISTTQLTAVIPAILLTTVGTATIFVYKTVPALEISNGYPFNIEAPVVGKNIVRLGDFSAGEGNFPPRPSTQGSPNVRVNSKNVIRVGDTWAVHTDGITSHGATSITGSATIFVNGRAVVRVGDVLSDGDHAAQGSPDTLGDN